MISSTDAPAVQRHQILVVDDNPRVRSRAATYLRRHGFEVALASNIEQAQVLADQDHPDLVICKLAWCDELAECIPHKPKKKHTLQFIQLFTNQSLEAVLQAFDRDNRDCLPVPFSERTLLLAINRAFERRHLIANNLRSRRRLLRANEQLESSLAALQADAMAGRQMQQSLLPPSPIVRPPYYYARKICPSLYLSGDFVNYAPALDDYLLFYLMDVSGHGASSAFVTVMVRQLMRRIVRRHVRSDDHQALARAPAGFLERINGVICDNDLEKYLTMFAGSINMRENRLRYAIGAQLPMPLLITPEGVEFLPGRGRPIGLYEGGVWDIYERELPEKYILLAFSDGVLEQLPNRNIDEQEAFMLERLRGCPADIDAVLPLLGIDNVEDLSDDIAVFMFARGHHEI